MRVDVVVPAHNAAAYLEETLDSILAQALPETGPFRLTGVLVVDDGSDDATSAIAMRYGATVRVIRTERVGNVAARNAALHQSEAELVAFCDADDVWEPTKLATQLPAFGDPTVVASCTALRQMDAAGKVLTTKGANWDEDTIRRLLVRDFVMPVPLSSWIVRRTAFDALDETLPVGADLDMASRVVRAGRVHYVAEPLLRYRVHGASISAARAVEQQLVRRYLQADDGKQSGQTYTSWRSAYRASRTEKRRDAAVYHFRSAGQQLSDGSRLRAGAHLLASGLLDPREFVRKVRALR